METDLRSQSRHSKRSRQDLSRTDPEASTERHVRRLSMRAGHFALVVMITRFLAPAAWRPARSEFHISKPDGLPVGKYKVEISVDGAAAASREFEVRAAS